MRRVTIGRLAAGVLGFGLVLVVAGVAFGGANAGGATGRTGSTAGSTGTGGASQTSWLGGLSGMMGSAGGYGAGMMGGAGGYGAGMMGGAGLDAMGQAMGSALAGRVGEPISRVQADALGAASPAGATVDRAANRITFATRDVRFAVLASPPDGKDLTFRIAGLVNPTIVVPQGASVSVQLINADPDMSHNFAVVAAQPPFSSMPMMVGAAFAGADSAPLGDPTSAGLPSETISFTASTAGTFTYLCQVPGHAAGGMYGTFEVSAA